MSALLACLPAMTSPQNDRPHTVPYACACLHVCVFACFLVCILLVSLCVLACLLVRIHASICMYVCVCGCSLVIVQVYVCVLASVWRTSVRVFVDVPVRSNVSTCLFIPRPLCRSRQPHLSPAGTVRARRVPFARRAAVWPPAGGRACHLDGTGRCRRKRRFCVSALMCVPVLQQECTCFVWCLHA